MSKLKKFFLQVFFIVFALVVVFFLWLKLFPNSPLGILEREWLHTKVISQTLDTIEAQLTWISDILEWETQTPIVASWDSLHFLYEDVAEKNIKESFIKSAFDDCETFDDEWKKEKCSDTEKNTYVFADYTLNFSIATWSLYYARDPASNEGSYEDGHIKIYVKDLSVLDASVRSRIDKELMDIWTRPWYIQTRILSDYWPIGLGWWLESQEVYEIPWASFPKADFSRIFAFFWGQEYPLTPYIALVFKKDTYLIGMFSYDTHYLPEQRQEKYFAYFQQDKFLNDANNYSYFVDYLKKNSEFTTYANTYLAKVLKVLELAE